MSVLALTSETFNYADYLSWPEEERWELIDGIPHAMSPGPTRKHQRLSMQLSVLIGGFLQGSKCSVFAAPFDVRLPLMEEVDEEIDTVVQPDLVVYCDTSKLDEKGGKGAPDWVIEILSPSTAKKDQTVKTMLYQRHGVQEYWIVDPEREGVQVFRRDETGNRFGIPQTYEGEVVVSPLLFPDLKVKLTELFAE
ncbi:MAG: Uma2 family endonuclease [Bacteroidota bacterium]